MPPRRSVSTCRPHCSRAPTRSSNELRTDLWRPTLEDENGKPLAGLGLLAKPTRLAIVLWLLVFFIGGASSSRFSAARQRGRSRRARSNLRCQWSDFSEAPRLPASHI